MRVGNPGRRLQRGEVTNEMREERRGRFKGCVWKKKTAAPSAFSWVTKSV